VVGKDEKDKGPDRGCAPGGGSGGVGGGCAARKTTPYKLEGGRLYIKVESHVWAQELHYDVEKIKRRIKRVLGIEIDRIITKS
jgi:hypothetical protein